MGKTFASKFNHTTFGIDTTNYEYVKLGDLYNISDKGSGDVVRKIDGIFVHRSKLGESPVFIVSATKQLVNIPQHLTDTCKEILSDDDAVEAIQVGKVGFVIYEYQSHGKNCYSVRFVDL